MKNSWTFARSLLGTSFVLAALSACGSDSTEEDDDAERSPVGRNCASDADCGPAGHCLRAPKGICSVPATGPCTDGSRAECPADSRCYKTNGGEYYCWADCDATCGSNGECDSDGSCAAIEPKGTMCSCSCSCSGCSATGTVTCSQPSPQCSSCSRVCSDICSSDAACGGYLSGSGSCS
jgi:hypothetical protein